MPDFEFEFNQQDKDLIVNQSSGEFGENDYIRLTIYPTEATNQIVTLQDNTKGIDGKAVFFSTLSTNVIFVNTSPFTNDNRYDTKIIGIYNTEDKNDFKIYRNENNQDIYIKPNEIFNEFELPQGDYKIQIDFLNQFSKGQISQQSLPIPYWYEDFNINNSDDFLATSDAIQWTNVGRVDIANLLVSIIFNNTDTPPYYYPQDGDDTNQELPGGDSDLEQNPLRGSEYYYLSNFAEGDLIHYKFIIKQISTSRKEVRLKILDENIENDSDIITNLTNELNQDTNEYQFKHVLNIGNGDHNPIMNFTFDTVTDGKKNQSLILKLYEPLPANISNLKYVTIEQEVLTTQVQDIFYFSDVADVFFGDGLIPQPQETWINPDGNDLGFQNFDEIAISSSIENIELDSLISSSQYDYPNLNTDFSKFENHTFFGSAKNKLENFNTKVKTIQGYYSDISSSLSMGGIAIGGDELQVIEKRKNLFQKIENEFKTFTPYERFLYFDGQSESSASAPSLKNYAQTIPVGPVNDGIELNQYDGFNVVYQRTNDTESIIAAGITPGSQRWIGITQDKYDVQSKPFFNYSSSIYLSFLMKGDETIDYVLNDGATKQLQWDQFGMSTTGNGLGVPLPLNTQFRERTLQPSITGSEYRRFIYHSSMSYWIPKQRVDFQDLPTVNNAGEFVDENFITILSGSSKVSSYEIKDSTNRYPITVTSQSAGVPFKGSCMPAGELFRLYFRGDLGGITSSFVTDVKVTLKNPTDVLPFDSIFKTTSTEYTDWYNNVLVEAETFDTNNIHSFENNLPLYIQNSSDFNEMKDFLNLQGEQYDLIRNHVDSMGTLHKRGYKKTNSPPNNTLPILLSNMGWESINPFEGDLTETLGKYLSGVTSIDDIKNNTWRKTLNNLLYIYKSKGTKNSVRALLNTYGYPPDVLQFQEFGGVVDSSNSGDIFDDDNEPRQQDDGTIDVDLNRATGSFNFTFKGEKFYRYRFTGKHERILNLDWWMDDANINTFQFVYKHNKTTNTQTILKSSGSDNETLWDLRLVPSEDGASSSFEFRLNNSKTGSLAIVSNGISMSTNYSNMLDGQLWNVMLQRMTGSTSTNIKNEYRLHTALQNNKIIETYNYVTMSINGAGGATNQNANKNFIGSGSRHYQSSSNLFVGETLTGSLGEIRGWSTTLSTSKFRQHTFNKFSIVGNSITSHCKELIYHFKLNENYGLQTDTESGSGAVHAISSSTQDMQIIDSAKEFGDYSFFKKSHIFLTSSVYGFDNINVVQRTLQDNFSSKNDNNIIINPNNTIVGDLNPFQNAVLPLTDKSKGKPKLNTSPKLELYRSPQNFINDFIISKIGGFNLEKKYASPINYYSQSYDELDTFRNEFFDCYPIEKNVNKFIRAHETMFNHSLSEGLKQVAPARSTFSDKNSNFGVEIKPTILEKQKYENHKHSVETNPNRGDGEIDFDGTIKLVDKLGDKQLLTIYDSIKEGEALGAPIVVGTNEIPHTDTISLGNTYVTSSGYLTPVSQSHKNHFHPPFLQPGGYVTTIENPHTASFIYSETKGQKNIPPTLNNSAYEASKDGIINYASIANESYTNVHSNWGTSSNDTQFINFAAGTSSRGDYNLGHIDTRFIFHSIGDTEYYSGSFPIGRSIGDSLVLQSHETEFENYRNFYSQLLITDGPAKNVKYFPIVTTGNKVLEQMQYHHITKDVFQNGKRMGKTRFFRVIQNFDDIVGNTKIILPSNHVNNFSQPFKDRMNEGTQNTNPGFLNVQHEDYSSASFYRVKVTGGENEIYVKGGNNPEVDSGGSDKIIY